ncbi:MAG: ABC transporter permease [Betaproteobacteria bacterium]|nr:ABC transporter permease [Betaproteobacteria bacterium]
MKPRLAVVFLKEIRDALRDRRTALMILVASVLTGPVTLILVASFVSGLEERASTLRVRIAGAENAPALVNFLERADVEIEKAPSDYLARVKEGALDAVIVVPEDFHERWLAHEEARVELVHDDSRTESGPATRQAERLLAAFNRETAYLRLMARGVSPSLNESTKVERVNTATPRQRGAVLLFLIPMFGILAPLLGGMTVAIDSTAGERERGSLEPLLANPVPARVFAIGKWLASWASATAVVTLTMAGFLAAARLYAEKRLPSLLNFGVPELAAFLAVIVPLAAFTSALQLLISTYGRSYREAQTYVSYLATVASFVPLVVMFSGAKEQGWQLAVPVLGQLMVLQRVLRGDGLSSADALVPAAVALVLAGLAVAAVARLLRDERIVFGRA